MLLQVIIVTAKIELIIAFSPVFKKQKELMQEWRSFYAIIEIKHLYLLGPLGVVKTLAFQAWLTTQPSGTKQMLMHWKSCLIP